MGFVVNIGDDLHLLSFRCCCLYFKWNLPLLLCFFWSKVIVLANYKFRHLPHFENFKTLSLFQVWLDPFNSEKVRVNLLYTIQRVLLAIKVTICVLHSSFMQLLSIYKK